MFHLRVWCSSCDCGWVFATVPLHLITGFQMYVSIARPRAIQETQQRIFGVYAGQRRAGIWPASGLKQMKPSIFFPNESPFPREILSFGSPGTSFLPLAVFLTMSFFSHQSVMWHCCLGLNLSLCSCSQGELSGTALPKERRP